MMQFRQKRPTPKVAPPEQPNRLVSMSEAMEYLSEKGYPCKSRHTFYRVIRENDIPYVDTNPNGKNEMRRFTITALDDFLRKQGLLM